MIDETWVECQCGRVFRIYLDRCPQTVVCHDCGHKMKIEVEEDPDTE